MTDEQELLRELLLEKYEPIAIVGAGLRFPGGNRNPDALAEFLREGRSGVGPIPDERWDVAAHAAGDHPRPGKITTNGGGFVDDLDRFDARFFNVSPKEAQYIDPQQRMVLETAWEALEHAAIDPAAFRGGPGAVYVGAGNHDWGIEIHRLADEEMDAHLGTGSSHAAISGRLSYFLGWRGPSVTVDTACSASLVALHLAVEGLRRKECDIALAGGVSAVHHPMNHIVFSQANMLSPDGECKTFDDRADGYGRSEGCGIVVLKRVTDALRDGDRVLAVVRGVAVRQDGDSGGLTVPSGPAQEGVMRAALAAANVDPADIGYVEAHGTGTPLGDPIEMGSIRAVFGASHERDRPLLVGSFKTNVGHMEAAAGIGGVIKAALQFAEPAVYPHLNLDEPSRHIPWESASIRVPTSACPWPEGRRMALVNSFGFAGTIASVVLEQPPPPRARAMEEAPHVFVLSAKDRAGLLRQVEKTRSFLAERPGENVGRLCATSTLGRTALPARLAGVVRTRADLDALLTEQVKTDQTRTADPVAFLFTGQGSQYPGMGAGLYQRFPSFRADVDTCSELFAPMLGRPVADWLRDPGTDAAELAQTRYTQPALFTLEYALARLWMSWGVRPSVLIGHSIGEVTAAAVAEVFTLADAVKLVEARGRLMQSVTTAGGMLSVGLAADDAKQYLEGRPGVAVAARNAPELTVLSGPSADLDAIDEELRRDGVSTNRLAVSHAFHSPLMAEVTGRFEAEIAGLTAREPKISIVSDVTGELADPVAVTTPAYWSRHIGASVDFVAGMTFIAARGRHTFLEIGPGATLTGLARRTVEPAGHTWLTSLHPKEPGETTTLASLAKLTTGGHAISWPAVWAGSAARRGDLPTYAFERRRYWLPGGSGRMTTRSTAARPLGGETVRLSANSPAYLEDHRVAGRVVFPAAGFVELILAAQDAVFGETTRPIIDLVIHEPLWLDEETEVRTRVTGTSVRIVSLAPGRSGRTGGTERVHVDAVLADAPPDRRPEPIDVPTVRPGTERRADDLYPGFADLGLTYGPRFRLLDEVATAGPGVAVGQLTIPPAEPGSVLPPPVLDCVFQAIAGVVDEDRAYLPIGLARLTLLKKPRGNRLTVVVTRRPTADDDLLVDLTVLEDGRTVLVVEGLALRRLQTRSRRRLLHQAHWIRKEARATRPGPRRVLGVGGRVEASDDLAVTTVADAAEAATRLTPETTDVCWFWRADNAENAGLRAESERHYRDLLALVGLLETAAAPHCRLWLITENTQRLPGDPVRTPDTLAAASLWGFGHTLWTEYPRFEVRLVDLPPGGDPAGLRAEIMAAEEREFFSLLRPDGRRVRRIRPVDPEVPAPRRLRMDRFGTFAGIGTAPADDVAPAGDQIQVRVTHAGINFKDVLNALGMVEELPLGLECAGTVVAAGPEAGFQPGDDVIVGAKGCMTELLTVSSVAAVRKPRRISFAEAAGVSTAYTSAFYALHDLAGLKAGDTVLIHAAAGGVGQAAVQLARLAGAEVIATASPGKWGLLRSQGVRHVMNSRTTEFADEVLAVTGGRGVDIVLNSLNKDFIAAGMRVVAEGGAFVELGKIGVLTPEEAAGVRPDVRYSNFDLSEIPEEIAGPLVKRIMTTVTGLLDEGALRPVPTTEYGLDEVPEAFGVLSRGGNVGKLVVRMRDEQTPVADTRIGPDETYLITGGLGGLAEAAGETLTGLGARHLALMGRTPADPARLAELRERFGPDVTVTAYAGNVADAGDVRRTIAEVQRSGAPLAGIVHAAGVLDDTPVAAMTWEHLDRVLTAKMLGTLVLHEAVADLPGLKVFAGFSSAAATLGPKGQANYAAANAYLDAVMLERAAAGLPALAAGWGAWSTIGMAAAMSPDHVRALENIGQRFLRPVEGIRALTLLLGRGLPHVVAGNLDWTRFAATRPLSSALYDTVADAPARATVEVDPAAIRALPPGERRAAIVTAVRDLTTHALHYDEADEISIEAPFTELGLDSLVAVELKNACENAFQIRLATGVVFDNPTVAALADHILELLP
jgi:acyl transferase domain-containing protein/NADPH:quinone reductase-like Zn-dependent oxidoreductase/acyl carrier protein